jgi:ABC-type proline/glycine betaine transport system ATPase subunit
VLVTHDQDEALSTADGVAVLRDGRIAQCDSPPCRSPLPSIAASRRCAAKKVGRHVEQAGSRSSPA